ncbi:hypothetical protein ACROYT_G012377 [Oculina patagonica]
MYFGEMLPKGKNKKLTKSSKEEEIPFNADRFRGEGVKFKCKLVGAVDVSSAEGDAMCVDAIKTLKIQAKLNKDSGEHKQRIVMYVTLNGIKIVDEKTQYLSLAETEVALAVVTKFAAFTTFIELRMEVQHDHPLKKVSYITPDPDDKNIFAWVFSQPGHGYKLFAVKSEKPATVLNETVFELFQVRFAIPEPAGLNSSQASNALHHSGEASLEEQLRGHVELRRQLKDMESQLSNCRGQLREKELQEASLHWQLMEKNRQKENSQGRLREVEQQLTHFQGQLREKELQEAILHEQLREKSNQQAMSQGQLRELEQQLTKMERQLTEKDLELENSERASNEREQRLTYFQGQLREKGIQEAILHEQLREKDQQEENSQRQLRDLEQQIRVRDVHEETLQRQLREMEQQLTNLQEQFREKDVETVGLQQQVTTLEGQLRAKNRQVNEMEITLSTARQALSQRQRQQTPDWVILRDQIQLTGRLLGRGGWGSVVEGRYCGCAVAVKQIHDLILSPHNLSLFEREMDIASRCRHPCLLQFIGATYDEENPLFVTELMESSLRALLEQRPLSATEVSIISLDVARGLSYLHQKKPSPIIHRDISSANVLLWRQGDQWRGKVSDYGTANFMQQTMTVAPGAMIYSAPEALTSNQTVKVDVYSFGVLLCEMCIRELPDPERRDQQISMVANHVLRALLRGCVQRGPETRPNMEEIIEELEEPVE